MLQELTKPQLFHMMQLKGAISLEMQGMKTKGGSAYAHAKRIYKLKGGRLKVLSWLTEMIKLQKQLKQFSYQHDACVASIDKEGVDYWEGAIQQTMEDIEELKV